MNTPDSVQDQLLTGQRAYYSALAPDYLDQGLDLPGGAELTDALDAFRPAGSVLELAGGPGTWTRQLLRHASDVTAVDASPEMLAIAASRVPGGAPVRFVQADLFTWEPDRRYDVVFMGSGCRTCPPGDSGPSGPSWPLPSRRTDGCSSPMTATARQMSSSRARHLPPSSGASLTGRPTGS